MIEAQRDQVLSTSKPSTDEPSSSTIQSNPVESTSKPAVTEANQDKNNEGEKSLCNHLPTYDSEEIQKVFREETTFKNGTIKGKFTYINFDQRYRLVHYTRLPYGPVKIDQVEELGRPKSGDNGQRAPSAPQEIPNAVLQLRNLLPNSMFGFPFLTPNSGQLKPRDGEDDKSNMYFYSTDSLSTPNLMNARIPLSLLPGQRVKIGQLSGLASSDPLAHSYLEHSTSPLKLNNIHQLTRPFGMPASTSSDDKVVDKSEGISVGSAEHSVSQFQYANSADDGHQLDASKPYSYPYFEPRMQIHSPVHYQYAPLSPVQPFAAQHHYQTHHLTSFGSQPHQSHQPHDHEHYMAQYMLAHPVATSGSFNDQARPENSRLRLRVKSSKSLNVNQGTKSAQLRTQPSEGHFSAPANSPMQMLNQRNQQQHHRRLGKQSHQLKLAQANSSPVVYHVLRNPSGRVYTQYNQGYAVAYDHE